MAIPVREAPPGSRYVTRGVIKQATAESVESKEGYGVVSPRDVSPYIGSPVFSFLLPYKASSTR